MPRDIPDQRLMLETYPLQIPMETRYSDMDSYAHLNNGAMGRLYENCRALMHIEIFQRTDLFVPHATERNLLVESRLRFLHEGHFPGSVMVGTGIGKLGRTSYHIHQALFQGDRCIGLCDSVMVRVVGDTPSAIEGELRDRFSALLATGAEGE